MKELKTLKEVITKRSTLFLSSFIIIALFYMIFTGIIVLNPLGLMLSRYALVPLLLVSLLSAAIITVEYDSLRKKKVCITKKSSIGYFGTVFSFLATACPFCKPLLIAVFGLGGAFGLLQVYGFQITLVSLALLLTSLFLVLRARSCK